MLFFAWSAAGRPTGADEAAARLFGGGGEGGGGARGRGAPAPPPGAGGSSRIPGRQPPPADRFSTSSALAPPPLPAASVTALLAALGARAAGGGGGAGAPPPAPAPPRTPPPHNDSALFSAVEKWTRFTAAGSGVGVAVSGEGATPPRPTLVTTRGGGALLPPSPTAPSLKSALPLLLPREAGGYAPAVPAAVALLAALPASTPPDLRECLSVFCALTARAEAALPATRPGAPLPPGAPLHADVTALLAFVDALHHSTLAAFGDGCSGGAAVGALPAALPLLARAVLSLCRFGDAALAAGQVNGVGGGARGGVDAARAARARAALDEEALHSLAASTPPLEAARVAVTPGGNLRVGVPGGFPSVVAPTPAHAVALAAVRVAHWFMEKL